MIGQLFKALATVYYCNQETFSTGVYW